MKKIENILLPPILVLLVLIFVKRTTTIDIHLHDTYYVIAHASLAKWFLYWLVVQFFLYTLIRRRHKQVNTKWAITHISITILLIGLIWFLADSMSKAPRYYATYAVKWNLYNQMIVIAVVAFLLSQIVFLVYFVSRLFQTPEPQ
jgi:heme/copper-type cytochrome/quinol oxidase subunit 1